MPVVAEADALDAHSKAAAVVTAPAPEKIPSSAFAKIPFVETAKISPEGKRFAGLMGLAGKQVIRIQNLFDTAEKAVSITIPDGTQARSVYWVNEDNVVVVLDALLPVEIGDRFYISRLIGINRSTGKVTKIFWDSAGQDAADIVWIPTDGSKSILLAAQNSTYLGEKFWPTVYRVDVTTGRKAKVLDGRDSIIAWMADGTGKIRAGIGYVDLKRSFQLLYRSETGDSSFQTISRADTRKREEIIKPFLFQPGTEHVLVMHDNDQGDSAIFEMDMATQRDVRMVYSAQRGEVDSLITSDDGSALLGVTTTSEDEAIKWFDPALAELQKQFDKVVPSGRVRIESMNKDRTKMLVRVSAPDMAGTLYYYDVDAGHLLKIASINEALGTRRLSPVKVIRYKARDGLEIEAILTMPNGRDPRNLPFIVMPHGGPWGQDTLSYDYWAQFLANLGYAVLQPNFRGSTGYGTQFVRKGEGQMGLAMQDDITDGVRWAVKEGIADPKRVCIVGASYGGYAAMWGIAKDPDAYRCAISIAGVANLRREVNDFGNSLMKAKFRDDWQRMTPDFAAVSPYNAVDRIKTPLLLIHGKKDVTVDYGQSARMYDRMREAGKDVALVSLPLADHHYTREADRFTLLSAMEQFLAKHNPAN